MQLDAERDGEGLGMCAGKTTQKDGLSTQLDEVTDYKVGILFWFPDKTNNLSRYATVIFLFRFLFQPCVAWLQLSLNSWNPKAE